MKEKKRCEREGMGGGGKEEGSRGSQTIYFKIIIIFLKSVDVFKLEHKTC